MSCDTEFEELRFPSHDPKFLIFVKTPLLFTAMPKHPQKFIFRPNSRLFSIKAYWDPCWPSWDAPSKLNRLQLEQEFDPHQFLQHKTLNSKPYLL